MSERMNPIKDASAEMNTNQESAPRLEPPGEPAKTEEQPKRPLVLLPTYDEMDVIGVCNLNRECFP